MLHSLKQFPPQLSPPTLLASFSSSTFIKSTSMISCTCWLHPKCSFPPAHSSIYTFFFFYLTQAAVAHLPSKHSTFSHYYVNACLCSLDPEQCVSFIFYIIAKLCYSTNGTFLFGTAALRSMQLPNRCQNPCLPQKLALLGGKSHT